MPNEWDYRVRFTIASLITCITSVFVAQPLFLAIVCLIILCCFPFCVPLCYKLRCQGAREDGKTKEFVGGDLLISDDVLVEYGDENERPDGYVDDDSKSMYSSTYAPSATYNSKTTDSHGSSDHQQQQQQQQQEQEKMPPKGIELVPQHTASSMYPSEVDSNEERRLYK